MSFGISIGDFIAVGKVIADISSNLRSSGGSKSEYQELERELETLQQILQQIDQLQSTHPNPTLDSVKYAALSCRHTLEQFLDKVQKYDHSLGVWSQPSKIRGAVDKLRWGIEEKDEVRKLQAYLNTHNAMINTLLLKLGLENMNAGFSSLKISGDRIQEITEDTHQSVVCIEQSVKKQEGLLDNFGLSLPKLIRALAQDFGSSWEKLAQMLSRLCESTEQIYTILVQIKTCTPAVNTRWTFFQDPVVVEDAFGVKFPVPSEYDGTLLHAIIRHRFSRGCEIQNVTDGGYSVFYTDDPSRSLSAIDHLFPGCRITVAAFVGYNVALGTPDCPICGSSNRAALPADGPHECGQCTVRFDNKFYNDLLRSELVDDFSTSGCGFGQPPCTFETAYNEANARGVALGGTASELRCFRNVMSVPSLDLSVPPKLVAWVNGGIHKISGISFGDKEFFGCKRVPSATARNDIQSFSHTRASLRFMLEVRAVVQVGCREK